jgi:energy-converting hydrogenase Eha subunit C
VVVALGVLACVYVLGGVFGVVRYRTPLNPLSFYTAVSGGITMLSATIVYLQLATAPYSADDVTRTAIISIAAYLGTLTPYLFRGPTPRRVFGQIVRWLGLDGDRIATRFSVVKFGLLLCASAASFVALAVLGGGGLRWITDTRNAYINNRSGAGPFFAATEWFLVFALLYLLWSLRPTRLRSLFLVVLGFAVAASFTGSKGNILIIVLVCTIYYHFRVRPIPVVAFLLMIPLALVAFLGLLALQGFRAEEGVFALVYFKDYFDTAAQFLSRFDEFGFRYGGATASELWAYVPRALYPDKPYEYGLTLVHRVLFPGAAETGNTPGILPWVTAYLDFGVIGVFLWGAWGSVWQRAAYEYYLKNRSSFFAFLLMMQFALWAPLPFATTGIAIVLSIGMSLYLRVFVGPRRPLAQGGASGKGKLSPRATP